MGGWALAENVYVLYVLLTGQVQPGERYWIDELAPTTSQALVSTLIACVILAIGFFAIRIAERYKAGKAPGA